MAGLVSVFTPTHTPEYLVDCWRSLQRQTYAHWEWVVVPNGPQAHVPDVIREKRLRIVAASPETQTIGGLKQLACRQCRGELLVELDHDDLLHPTCLERLVAVQATTEAGFLHSDCVQFFANGQYLTYDPRQGWETYQGELDGVTFTATKALSPTPASLRQIYWAPNHVRAWTREAYTQIGGHNPALTICDDYELVLRTWVHGTRFATIHEPLYFYRERPEQQGNTYRARLLEIQELSQKLSNQYHYQVVAEWARRQQLLLVDFAVEPQPGYVAITEVCPDWTSREAWTRDWSVGTAPLLFAPESVAAVRIYDYLQRLPAEQALEIFLEAYHWLAPLGWLQLAVPSTEGGNAAFTPLSRSYWNRDSWRYLTTAAGIDELTRGRYTAPPLRFQGARIWDYPCHGALYSFADLCAAKGDIRPPGPLEC